MWEPGHHDRVATLEAERRFHDAEYARAEHDEKLPETREEFIDRFVAIASRPFWQASRSYYSDARRLSLRMANPSGRWEGLHVLDVGCGLGELALGLGIMGGSVDAFDLSPVGVERAQRAAERYGLAERVRFRTADANMLPYSDSSFDLVMGWGVLHHLVKYPEAARELARVVKPRGILVWQETWGENPLLNVVRRRYTLAAEDAGDVFITYPILRAWAEPHLRVVRVRHLSLCYMVKRFTRPSRRPSQRLARWQQVVLALAQGADAALTRVPLLCRLGAEAVMVMRRNP